LQVENLFVAGTYEKILARIAQRPLKEAEVLYETKVVKITSGGPHDMFPKITATTDKAETLVFDELVMTAPLGWLQKNEDAFEPPLPERFSQAIHSIGYGCLEKVYITFPRAFWQEKSRSAESSNPLSDSNGADKDSNAAEGPFTGFTQWITPNYSTRNPHHWNQEIVNLASLPASCAHPTLLFYISGDQSRTFAKDLASLSPEEETAYLQAFFEPYYSRLPNYNKDDVGCVPENFHATRWVLDDLAGNGSYSNFPVGLKEGDKDIITMREGLPERRLWFAGEHTAPFIALGMVTGAYWSGETVGKRIAKAYGFEVEDTLSDTETTVESRDGEVEGTVSVRGLAETALEL
jgi:hypothetical protein